MRFLLRTLSLSYVRQHVAKTLLTLLGVVVGVATFSSIQSAQGSLLKGLRATVDKIAGKAHLQITMVGGVPEEIQSTLHDLPGIRAISPVIEQVVMPEKGELGSLLVIGVDLLGDREMRDYGFEGQDADLDDPLLFIAQPDSALFTKAFADRVGMKMNDTVPIKLPKGVKRVAARGFLSPKGFGESFGGNLMIMDIYAAQDFFGRGRRFDRIDVRLTEDTSLAKGTDILKQALGPAFTIETPRNRSAQMEKLVANFTAGFNVSSIFALCIGIFLIFNAFNVAVNRRRRDIGTLRAIGATPRQVQGIFLLEALVIGLLGGALGCAAGMSIAQNFLELMSRTTDTVYGISTSGEVTVSAGIVIQSLVLGVCASLAGAWGPALTASRIPPTEAFAKGAYQSRITGSSWPWVMAGIAAFSLAVLFAYYPPVEGNAYILSIFTLGGTGVVLVIGPLSRWILHRVIPLIDRYAPVAGQLAADSLLGNIRRTSGTLKAMALSLTFVLGLGGYMGATKLSMTKWMDNILTSDIYVRASANFIRPDFIFPASLKDELMNIPGVEAIESYRGVRPEYKGRNILVNSIDFGPYMDRSKNEYIQGDDASIRQGLVHEGKCAVSENFYRIFGLGMGQEVELMTPGGLVKIPIAAVVRDYNSDQGTIILDRPTFLKLWKDDRVDTFDVSVKPGVDIETVRTEIRKILAGRYPSILSTRHEFIVEITRAIDAFYALTQITVFLALGVAFLGIVASLLISVVERTREIGILKALGALSGQITRSIVLEALALSFVSLVLAIPAGNLFAHFMEGPVAIMFSGWSMPHCYPVATLTQLLIALPLVSVLAAWVPARQALNLKVTEAIEYE